jgi:hypothetical protein
MGSKQIKQSKDNIDDKIICQHEDYRMVYRPYPKESQPLNTQFNIQYCAVFFKNMVLNCNVFYKRIAYEMKRSDKRIRSRRKRKIKKILGLIFPHDISYDIIAYI